MNSGFHRDLTLALHAFQAGDLITAESKAKAALTSNSRSADALHLLGVIRGIQNRHPEAEQFLRTAAEYSKKNSFIFFNLAKALSEQGKNAESIPWHKKVLASDPKNAMAWLNYGQSLYELENIDDAIKAFNQAIAINKNFAEAYTNKGNCLRRKELLIEAVSVHDQALALNPKLAEAWINHGNCLDDLKRYEEALSSYDRAIELNPRHAEAWTNRGNSLNNLNRYEEALASYDRAIELNPRHAEAWTNRGNSLNSLKRYEEALASYDRAIELKPDYADAHYNKGLFQLEQGSFLGGFKNYLWRWQRRNAPKMPFKTSLPSCSPDSLDSHVLFWAEQGIGDEIFYASLLPQANSLCSKITISADKRLHSIFERSFSDIDLIDRKFVSSANLEGRFDAQAPIGNLGYLLRLNSDTIAKSRRSFLLPDYAKTSHMKQRSPFTSGKIVCGLSWKSANKDFGSAKSLRLTDFELLLKNRDLSFVNLQYGSIEDDVQHIKSRFNKDIYKVDGLDIFNDIDGLLSLIDACDVVITASNVTAHLAGSIGKRGCVLVPFSKGKIWYWHLNDLYSLWYPSLRVFYQDRPDSWANTIDQMIFWLEENYL